MYDYRIIQPLSLRNSNELTAVLDLGCNITTRFTFKLARIKVPSLDLSAELDPEIALRNFIIQWLKTSPGPLSVQLYKNDGVYTGDIIDANGTVLADELVAQGLIEGPQPDRNISEDDTVYFDAVKHGI